MAGLEGVVVADTVLSEVDGERGRLVVRGGSLSEFAGELGFEEATASFERELLLEALERSGWNQTRAAERLRITRRALKLKIDRNSVGYVPVRSTVYVSSIINRNTKKDLNETITIARERPPDRRPPCFCCWIISCWRASAALARRSRNPPSFGGFFSNSLPCSSSSLRWARTRRDSTIPVAVEARMYRFNPQGAA